jgi:hypothetical protein
MLFVIYLVITGLLVRADGWGTDNPKLQPLAKFFDVWTCASLFTLLSTSLFGVYTGLASGAAFFIYRLSGFDGWKNWKNMYWRGLWTSAIGFTLVSIVVHGHAAYGLLAIPFSAIYMLIYSGAHNYLPENIGGFNKHVWVEHSSGWVFGSFLVFIISSTGFLCTNIYATSGLTFLSLLGYPSCSL